MTFAHCTCLFSGRPAGTYAHTHTQTLFPPCSTIFKQSSPSHSFIISFGARLDIFLAEKAYGLAVGSSPAGVNYYCLTQWGNNSAVSLDGHTMSNP